MTRSPGGFKTVSSSGHIPATPRLEALTPQALVYSCATGKSSKGTWTSRRERQVTPCRNQLSRVSSCDLRARSWETAVLAKPLIRCTRWIRRDRSGRSFAYWAADTDIYRHDTFCSQAKPATANQRLGDGSPHGPSPWPCIATSAKTCGQPNSPVIRCAPACPPRPKSTSATCRTAATTADATDLGSI